MKSSVRTILKVGLASIAILGAAAIPASAQSWSFGFSTGNGYNPYNGYYSGYGQGYGYPYRYGYYNRPYYGYGYGHDDYWRHRDWDNDGWRYRWHRRWRDDDDD
jgi:hypothetical protein